MAAYDNDNFSMLKCYHYVDYHYLQFLFVNWTCDNNESSKWLVHAHTFNAK